MLSCTVIDKTIRAPNKFGDLSNNHVLPPVDFEPLWVWTRPFVCLHLFPNYLSPSPPLNALTSESLRTDFVAVHPCHMSSPTEHTITNGHQHVPIAFLDPMMSSPMPESPPLSHLHSCRCFFTPTTFATILALQLAILSLCALTVVQTLELQKKAMKRRLVKTSFPTNDKKIHLHLNLIS